MASVYEGAQALKRDMFVSDHLGGVPSSSCMARGDGRGEAVGTHHCGCLHGGVRNTHKPRWSLKRQDRKDRQTERKRERGRGETLGSTTDNLRKLRLLPIFRRGQKLGQEPEEKND